MENTSKPIRSARSYSAHCLQCLQYSATVSATVCLWFFCFSISLEPTVAIWRWHQRHCKVNADEVKSFSLMRWHACIRRLSVDNDLSTKWLSGRLTCLSLTVSLTVTLAVAYFIPVVKCEFVAYSTTVMKDCCAKTKKNNQTAGLNKWWQAQTRFCKRLQGSSKRHVATS